MRIATCLFLLPLLSQAATLWTNGFETNTAGWSTSSDYGTVTRVCGGPLQASSGSCYAAVTAGPNTTSYDGSVPELHNGPYTYFNTGVGAEAPGTSPLTTFLDVYLDVTSPTRFTWDTLLYDASGNYLNELYVMANSDTGGIAVAPIPGNSVGDPALASDKFLVTAGGWYTFQNTLYDNGGKLLDRIELLNGMTPLASWTIDSGEPTNVVSGKICGWFAGLETGHTLAIDNSTLADATPVPEPASFALILGFVPVLYACQKRLLR